MSPQKPMGAHFPIIMNTSKNGGTTTGSRCRSAIPCCIHSAMENMSPQPPHRSPPRRCPSPTWTCSLSFFRLAHTIEIPLVPRGGANLWNAKAEVILRFSLCSCSSCVSPAASTLDKASKAPPARHTRPRQPRRQHVTQGGANIPVKPLRTGAAQILVSDLKVTLRMRCCGRCHIRE